MSKIIATKVDPVRVPYWDRSEGEEFLHGPNDDEIPVYALYRVSGGERTEVGYVERRYEVKSETRGKWMYEEDWYRSLDGHPAAEEDIQLMCLRASGELPGDAHIPTRVVWALRPYAGRDYFILCPTLRDAKERV